MCSKTHPFQISTTHHFFNYSTLNTVVEDDRKKNYPDFLRIFATSFGRSNQKTVIELKRSLSRRAPHRREMGAAPPFGGDTARLVPSELYMFDSVNVFVNSCAYGSLFCYEMTSIISPRYVFFNQRTGPCITNSILLLQHDHQPRLLLFLMPQQTLPILVTQPPNKARGRPSVKLGDTILICLLASRSIRRKDD